MTNSRPCMRGSTGCGTFPPGRPPRTFFPAYPCLNVKKNSLTLFLTLSLIIILTLTLNNSYLFI